MHEADRVAAGDVGAGDAEARLASLGERVFFVVGSGRSGTSLLQNMISCHPEVMLPNETKYYTVLEPRLRRRFGERVDRAAMSRVVEYVLGLWWISDLELDRDEVEELATAGACDYGTLFLAILGAYGRKHGASLVGEKSPGHFFLMDRIASRFPGARFVHVLRDPRAVCLSKTRMNTDLHAVSPDVAIAASDWAKLARVHANAERELGAERYHVVRYESLVTAPEETLRGVCGFLRIDFDEAMLEHHKRQFLGFGEKQRGHMENTLKPLFESSIEKWREELTPRQIGVIETIIGDEMVAMGYEPTGARAGLVGLRLLKARATLRARWMWHRLRHPGQHEPGGGDTGDAD